MKKLKLNALAFNKGEVLSRTQLKNVLGGDGSGSGSGVDGGGSRKKCCYTQPEVGCSECVTVPEGSSASCPTGGTLTDC